MFSPASRALGLALVVLPAAAHAAPPARTNAAAVGPAALVPPPDTMPAAVPDTGARPVFDIPAQPLADALRDFARQSGRRVAVDPALVAGMQAPAVRGAMPPDEALGRLLAGSGLVARLGANTVALARRGDATRRPHSRA